MRTSLPVPAIAAAHAATSAAGAAHGARAPAAARGVRALALAALAALLAVPAAGARAQAPAATATAVPASTPAPMLARVYRPGSVALAEWRVSEKLDGVRGRWDGARLVTRGGRVVAAPAWFTHGWPAEPLDGELWAGRGGFETAQSAAAAAVPDDAVWRRMRYMVFDAPAAPGPFDDRIAHAQRLVAAAGTPWLQAVAQDRVADEAALRALLDRTVRAGGEGLMLRRGDSPYVGERSGDMLKLKPFDDAEARVVAHLPGRGRHAGRLGALLVETPAGLRFRLGTGLGDAERADPPPVGSIVTYRHAGLHEGGLPRFASFLRMRTLQ